MFKRLSMKFLLLLLAVSMIALSAALFLRELMLKDFREYLEGEMEDRVYWVIANLEGKYEKESRWKGDLMEDAIWALMLGFEIKIKDDHGNVVMDTERAVSNLPPLMRKRVKAISRLKGSKEMDEVIPYPLFLGGKGIGSLEVRFLGPRREDLFIERTNKFLLLSLFALGGLAIILSIAFSKKLTSPIRKLASAANDISEGNLKSRVKITGNDEISRLSDTFNRMARHLEIQESLRKRLISNVAHELRTPIAALRGELEGMMDGFIQTGKEHLQSLYEETSRLRNILEGIEDLSQAEASTLSLRKEPIQLKPFLRSIVERFSKLFLDGGVFRELQCDDDLTIDADPERLSQIMINLLSNALKATQKGGCVRIRTTKEKSEVLIQVEDTGCGIRKEDLPFIFERFYKVADGGLGLGLAIAKELAEAHGGRIEAKSEYGKGSTFITRIPVK